MILTSHLDAHDVQLALTDRRLLWLRDDAIMGRVRSVRYRELARRPGQARPLRQHRPAPRPLRPDRPLAALLRPGPRGAAAGRDPDIRACQRLNRVRQSP